MTVERIEVLDPEYIEETGQPGAVWRKWKFIDGIAGIRKFDTPEQLWNAAVEYFEWNQSNPLITDKVFCNPQGIVTRVQIPKARVMTIQALCLYLNISRETFHKWTTGHDHRDLVDVCLTIREVIYAQKFEGAASDLFNPTVISRDLGLRDVKELTGPNGGPMQMISSDMTPQEAASLYAATLQDSED